MSNILLIKQNINIYKALFFITFNVRQWKMELWKNVYDNIKIQIKQKKRLCNLYLDLD